MMLYLQYALLIALVGVELSFVLRGPHLRSRDERRLAEAAAYTIIDATPKETV